MAINGIEGIYKEGYAILILGGPNCHWKYKDKYYTTKAEEEQGEYVDMIDYEGKEVKLRCCKLEKLM